MIATIGTVLVYIILGLLVLGVGLCAFVGLMFLSSYSAWKR